MKIVNIVHTGVSSSMHAYDEAGEALAAPVSVAVLTAALGACIREGYAPGDRLAIVEALAGALREEFEGGCPCTAAGVHAMCSEHAGVGLEEGEA